MEDAAATQKPLRSILWRGEVVGRPPPGRTRLTFTSAAVARRTPLRGVSVMQRPPHQLTHTRNVLASSRRRRRSFPARFCYFNFFCRARETERKIAPPPRIERKGTRNIIIISTFHIIVNCRRRRKRQG